MIALVASFFIATFDVVVAKDGLDTAVLNEKRYAFGVVAPVVAVCELDALPRLTLDFVFPRPETDIDVVVLVVRCPVASEVHVLTIRKISNQLVGMALSSTQSCDVYLAAVQQFVAKKTPILQ